MTKIAIVGCGPRGLSALENVIREFSEEDSRDELEICVFDPCEEPGAGPVWGLNQSKANWVNISDRALEALPKRKAIQWGDLKIKSFPSFKKWFKKFDFVREEDVDSFPPRSTLGTYLYQRYKSIADELERAGVMKLVDRKIININHSDDQFSIEDEKGTIYKADECLLTIGHQPTKDDDQIKAFEQHAEEHKAILFKDPYEHQIGDVVKVDHVVAFRGMGLSMIDNIRLLTSELGGAFVRNEITPYLEYKASERSVKKLLPFSLDGIFPSPKPIGVEVDRLFEPSEAQQEQFINDIRKALSVASTIDTPQFLIDSAAKIAAENYMELGDKALSHDLSALELEVVCKMWLEDMQTRHPLITSLDQPCLDYLKAHSEMALGTAEVSLDYYLGQLWRHLQPIKYRELSYSELGDKTMERIIEMDESTKRYSFGPPVESTLELIALIEAGVLDTTFADDPEIGCVPGGWQLRKDKVETKVDVLINCVLDRPKLMAITSPLVCNLLEHEMLQPVTSELGVETNRKGLVLMENGEAEIPLAMLGRICKGSKMGVDAILECFDKDTKTWAQGVRERKHR